MTVGTYSPFVLALTDALLAAEGGWQFWPLERAWTHPLGLRASHLSGRGVRVSLPGRPSNPVVSSGKREAAEAAHEVAEKLIEMARTARREEDATR